jgi:hypothetical protein
MTRTYRYGYNAYETRLTEEQLLTRWGWRMVHPELRRRSLRMMQHAQDAGTDLGIGSGARNPEDQLREALRRHDEVPCDGSVRIDRRYNGKCYRLKPGMAPYAFPGSSNHETGILEGFALAIDYIGWENHWFDRNCERFGIKNFGGAVGLNVNGEEWHGQPLEFSNSRSAINREVANGRRLIAIPLPGDPTIPKPQPPLIPTYPGASDMFQPIHPRRNSDTRIFGGAIPANQTRTFGLDPSVFPANTVAIAMNVTVLGAPAGAFLTVWGSGPTPNTSVVNVQSAGAAVSGYYAGPVQDLKFNLQASHSMNVICDVTGFWTP